MIRFGSINDAQKYFFSEILSSGENIRVREKGTKEITNISFCLDNPRNRITTLKGRHWNYTLAIGELLWHLRASKDLDSIAFYNEAWRGFSDNGYEILGSCYGSKIFGKNQGPSPWDQVKKLIQTDINTRRAVISLFENTQLLNIRSLDYSCVMNVQFLVRQKKLDMIVNMRSNDLVFGLPYDVFVFTFFQEILSVELGIPLGSYYHNTTSLHIYDNHYDKIRKILLLNSAEVQPTGTSLQIVRSDFRKIAIKLYKWVVEGRSYEEIRPKIGSDKNLEIFFFRLSKHHIAKREG